MTRFHVFRILTALLATAGTAGIAGAQRETGTAAAPHAASPSRGAKSAPAHPASGGAWTGRASQWGGSPPPVRSHEHAIYPVGRYGYIPIVVVELPPVPVAADSAAAAYDTGVTEMRVITTHAPRELTTMDVYRQQRFARP
jgi:hypothetical protein